MQKSGDKPKQYGTSSTNLKKPMEQSPLSCSVVYSGAFKHFLTWSALTLSDSWDGRELLEETEGSKIRGGIQSLFPHIYMCHLGLKTDQSLAATFCIPWRKKTKSLGQCCHTVIFLGLPRTSSGSSTPAAWPVFLEAPASHPLCNPQPMPACVASAFLGSAPLPHVQSLHLGPCC